MHLCAEDEDIRRLVEPYAGKQFTPADPVTILGALLSQPSYGLPHSAGLVRKTELGKRVHIDLANLSEKGYLVKVENSRNNESKLEIVTAIDTKYMPLDLIVNVE